MPPDLEIAKRADDGPLPRRLGRYTLLAPLGGGSTCEAFLALTGAPGTERACVVKRVRSDRARSEPYVARFLAEGRALAASSHGAVAQVLDVGRSPDGVPFLAMEHVDGRDLGRAIDAAAASGRRIPAEIAMHVVVAVLDGLAFAWGRRDGEGAPLRLLHGALSPRSVVCSWDGQVKIVDLGLARAVVLRTEARSGVVSDAPAYRAPELLRGDDFDARTDLFAVGLLLWELLSTSRLVAGDFTSHVEEVSKGRFLAPPLAGKVPRVPPDLDRIIARATAAKPDQRYRDAAAMRNEVAEVLHRLAPGTGATHVASMLEGVFAEGRERDRAALAALLESGRDRASATGEAPAVVRPLAAGPDQVPGTRYRILSKIGEGGAGTVYDAVHVDLERRVALKILHAAASANPEFVERFRQEARAVARLGHENIIAATDFGQTADGRVFFAMERLEGESLGERMGNLGALEIAESLKIIEQVLRGLAAAHAVGLVHRDVKPENVFLAADGKVKLLDFGIAKAMGPEPTAPKLTRDGIAIGTPEYMAPEQAAAGTVDARTDVYSVGVVLYEMVTGSIPFSDDAIPKLLVKHMEEAPERPSIRAPSRAISKEVEAIVLRALEKEPAKRFASALAMAQAVEDAMRGLATPLEVPAPAPPVALETRPDLPTSVAEAARRAAAPPPSRAPRIAVLVGLGIVLVGGGLWIAGPGADAPAPSVEADGEAQPPREAEPTRPEPGPDSVRPAPVTTVASIDPPATAAPQTAAPETAAGEVAPASSRERSEIDVHLARARSAFRRGDLATARSEVTWVLNRDDDDPRAIRLLEQITKGP